MAIGGGVASVESLAELKAAVSHGRGGAAFSHFWAPWCEPSKQMDAVFEQLAADYPHAKFFRVDAEAHSEITEAYGVSTVPFFICFKDGEVVDNLEGANAPVLAHKVAKTAGPHPVSSVAASFPESVGLSSGAAVLGAAQDAHGASSNGMHAEVFSEKSNGDSSTKSESKDNETETTKRLQTLINGKPVMLFMKGTPAEPRCGFSKKVVGALNETGTDFGSFNILSDEGVRQGLKAFSNWPTYPQLYLNGELLGGCDIILEMSKSGELKQTLEEAGLIPKKSLEQRLKELLNSSDVLLFMKGTPEEPRCGFSRKVVGALQEDGIQFGSFNILSDEEVRQGLKTYSNWPTYPQLYHKGELIGGCDIILEMKASGELKSTLVS